MSQMRTLRDYAPSFSSEKKGPEEKCGGGEIPDPFAIPPTHGYASVSGYVIR
jgi:hypothetical protein